MLKFAQSTIGTRSMRLRTRGVSNVCLLGCPATFVAQPRIPSKQSFTKDGRVSKLALLSNMKKTPLPKASLMLLPQVFGEAVPEAAKYQYKDKTVVVRSVHVMCKTYLHNAFVAACLRLEIPLLAASFFRSLFFAEANRTSPAT